MPHEPTILIVDDDARMRSAVRDLLSAAFPRCRLLEAGTSEQALESCRGTAPEIVVMDIQMPVTNGIETASHMRLLDAPPRILIHSQHDSAAYRERAAAAGASAFVSKSASYRELVPAVEVLLASLRGPAS